MMLALGLDTSCYTTSCALCDAEGGILQARKILPVSAGERGLRQSEAVFAHVRQMSDLLPGLLHEAREPISCVCASLSPRDGEDSYMPVFQVGYAQGRSIAAALRVPFYATTHQRGHIAAAQVGAGLTASRFLALHLSGGTTDVLLVDGEALSPISTSLDLHAGQLVDRVGVALDLPFPSGPYLEELARQGTCKNLIPVSMDKDGLCCHLSGAEAGLLRLISSGESRENVAAEVYGVLCRTVTRLLTAAAEKTGAQDALLAGGVISSALLREMLIQRNQQRRAGLHLHFGRPELSGDNAVGVALLGLEKYKKERQHGGIDGR